MDETAGLSYQDRQGLIQSRMQNDIRKHPDLMPSTQGKVKGVALASKNIKRMLKKAFPGTKFSVTSSRFSGGTSIDVRWDGWDDAPSSQEVGALISRFGYFKGTDIDDSAIHDKNWENEAWRAAFGSVKYLHCQAHPKSDAENAARRKQALESVIEVEEVVRCRPRM